MAAHLDYICPMIYPSHYGDGNFGIEHPDTEPYRTILAALQKSSGVLEAARQEGQHQAIVRPWLQDFTASYLKHYIEYGPEEIRAQIQATYDAGYDEWMLWSAACSYTWDGLKTKEEARRSGRPSPSPGRRRRQRQQPVGGGGGGPVRRGGSPAGNRGGGPAGRRSGPVGGGGSGPAGRRSGPAGGGGSGQSEAEAAAQPGEEAAQPTEAGQEPRESQEPAPVLESLPTLPAHISPRGHRRIPRGARRP